MVREIINIIVGAVVAVAIGYASAKAAPIITPAPCKSVFCTAGATGTGTVGVLQTSPTLLGVPLAPTAAFATNTTQIATTAFVTAAISGGSPVISVFGRTGAIVAATNDYTFGQIGSGPINATTIIGSGLATFQTSVLLSNAYAGAPSGTLEITASSVDPSLGVGTGTQLHIVSDATHGSRIQFDALGNGGQIVFRSWVGSSFSTATPPINGTALGTLIFSGFNGITAPNAAIFTCAATETFAVGANGSQCMVRTTKTGTTTINFFTFGNDGSLTIPGAIFLTGTIPVATGTGTPVMTTGSTDTAGEVTGGTLATSIVITFAVAKTNAPFCNVTPETLVAAFNYTVSTTAITITLTATTGEKVTYSCFQH